MPDALTRLADAATGGPWTYRADSKGQYGDVYGLPDDGGYDEVADCVHQRDGLLIALAPDLARVAIQLAAALHALTPEPNTSGGSEIPNARAALAAYQELVDRSKLLDAFAAARGNEEETDA